ncbi:MAG: AAA family ATPase [Candidatus Saccharimonadales bacterium]
MYSPDKAHHRIGKLNEPLPAPYPIFDRDDVRVAFRRGSASLIAGTPGSFKTALALNMASKWADRGIRSLYYSADGDESSILKRLAGITTGDDMKEVEWRIEMNKAHYAKWMHDRYHKKLEFEYAKMSWDNFVFHTVSYEQVYGGFPDLIIIDNLIDFASNVYAFGEMQQIISAADQLAKKTQAHVMILHHARLVTPDKGLDNVIAGNPPPDNEIQGRMTQFPTLALTLGVVGTQVRWAAVKNRTGPQYRDASVHHRFNVKSSMRIDEG